MSRRKNTRNGPLRSGLPMLLGLFWLACSSVPPTPAIPGASDDFSEPVVRAHLENLRGLGARLPGGPADEAARAYLTREFAQAGVTLDVLQEGPYRHLSGVLLGRSQHSVLLVAPYPVLGSDAWVDDAGAALLLEVARVLARAEPPPYSVRFVLAETLPPGVNATEPPALGVEEPSGRSVEPDADSLAGPSRLGAREQVAAAGASLASILTLRGELDQVRAVIAFEPRAGVAPRMARDLRSHPVFRSIFWDVAEELGHQEFFPADGGWRSPGGLQAAFQAAGHSQVLALVDETTARVELQAELGRVPGGGRSDDARLEPIGRVTVEALERLMHRFARIDAFSESPPSH